MQAHPDEIGAQPGFQPAAIGQPRHPRRRGRSPWRSPAGRAMPRLARTGTPPRPGWPARSREARHRPRRRAPGPRPRRCRNGEPPRTMLGAPAMTCMPARLGRRRGLHGDREFADADAVGGVFGDLVLGAVVVAGERDGACRATRSSSARRLRVAQPRALRLHFLDAALDRVPRPGRRGGAGRGRSRDRRTGRRRGCGPSG